MKTINKTRIISFVLVAIMLLLLVQPSNAEYIPLEDEETETSESVITPRWSNVSSSTATCSFSNGKVSARVYVGGYSGTTYKNGTVKLYKNSGSGYTVCKTWTGLSGNSSAFVFNDNTITAIDGCSYKISVTITAVNSGTSETITVNSTAQTY